VRRLLTVAFRPKKRILRLAPRLSTAFPSPAHSMDCEYTSHSFQITTGFPEESEKFFALGEITLINQHLWALSKNEGR
jgi:hypothetical protein